MNLLSPFKKPELPGAPKRNRRQFWTRRRLITTSAIMATGFSVYYLIGVEQDLMRDLPNRQIGPTTMVIMTQVTMQQHENRRLLMEIHADQAEYDQQTEKSRFQNVRFTFAGSQNNPSKPVSVWGQAGYATLENGLFILRNQVQVHHSDHLSFTSPTVEYHDKRREIRAPGKVWLQQNQTNFQGKNLIYSLRDERLTIQAPLLYQ